MGGGEGGECPALSYTLNTMTKVRPLSKTPNPQLLPGRRSSMTAHCSGCVFTAVFVCVHLVSEYGSPYLASLHLK